MKVFIPIAHYYPSNIGGPANTIYWFVKALGRYENVETSVVTSCLGIDKKESIQPNIMIDYSYGLTNYINTKQPKTSASFILSSIKETAKSDIVYLPSLFFPPTVVIFLFGFFFSKKIILSPRGQLFEAALSRHKTFKLIYIRFFRLFSKRIYWHATSNIEKNQINALFKTKNCFILPNYLEPAERQKAKKKNQFIFLGRINPIKGLYNFILCLSQNERFLESDSIFLIAGAATLQHEVEYKIMLEKLIIEKNLEKKISFLGVINGKEKERFLAESHCLVLPSFSENFGNVVLESLNQGTPVLTTTGTPWELLEEKQCGWWVENNVDSLLIAVNNILLQDDSNYQQFCKNARLLIDQEFDINKNVYRWYKTFSQLINKSVQN